MVTRSRAGFRAGYSTIDNVFTLHAIAQKYLAKPGGRFYRLFVDFSKAFDRIRHKLWASLFRKSIHGKFLRIFQSMYGRLSACVRTNGIASYFPCSIGTRQRCVSGPLMFSLFIDDLAKLLREECGSGIFITNDIPDILCLLFADDIANCAETPIKLKRQIDS